jgi:hypothetical protein
LIEKVNETELQKLARSLSAIIVDHVNNKMVNQYEVSRNLMGMEITDVSQGVKGLRVFAFRSKDAQHEYNHRRPIYTRTRIINVSQLIIGEHEYVILKCSCAHWFQQMCACRHAYALLNRYPEKHDVFPEKTKAYELLYDLDQDFTSECDARTQLLEKAGGLVLKCRLEDIKLSPE